MARLRRSPIAAASLALLVAVSAADAGVITFSTLASTLPAAPGRPEIAGRGVGRGQALAGSWGWNYDGNPATPRSPVHASNASFVDNVVCIGPAGDCAANDILAPAGNEYVGYEFIHFGFELPADAYGIEVHFGRQLADDRHALLVNGLLIGGFKSGYPEDVFSPMKHDGGVREVPFHGTLGEITLDDPALFHAGSNTLSFWLNNTFSADPRALARAHAGPGDPSALQTWGWISYRQPADVPEPAVAWLLLAAATAAAAKRRT